MAPHEWIRTVSGAVLKTDVWGHDLDHTCVGPQPIHWDVAGTIVEWRMSSDQIHMFLGKLRERGMMISSASLEPYIIAWNAFKTGLLMKC
jgi:hypothetical protein